MLGLEKRGFKVVLCSACGERLAKIERRFWANGDDARAKELADLHRRSSCWVRHVGGTVKPFVMLEPDEEAEIV
jgi:hypothetical protein